MSADLQPIPLPGDTLGDILAAALNRGIAERRELDERARYCAGFMLTRQIAPLIGATETEVWQALCTVPEPMLDFLQTPEGWSALARYIAADFDGPALNYMPTRH